jgi:hypothetical protein
MARRILDSIGSLLKRKMANIRVVTPKHDSTEALVSACLSDNNKMAEKELKALDCIEKTGTGSFIVSESEGEGFLVKRAEQVRRVDGVVASMKNSMNGENRQLGLLMKDKWLELRSFQRDCELPVLLILVDIMEDGWNATPETTWKSKLGIADDNVEIISLLQKDVCLKITEFRAKCTKRMEIMDKERK